jgi:hypothetical protein
MFVAGNYTRNRPVPLLGIAVISISAAESSTRGYCLRSFLTHPELHPKN